MRGLVITLALTLALAGTAGAQDDVHTRATTSEAAFSRVLIWQDSDAAPDTAGMAWTQAAGTDHGGAVAATLTAPAYVAGDSSMTITWNRNGATGVDHYILLYRVDTGAGWGSWAVLDGDIPSTTEEYVWPTPRRGKFEFTIYAANADESETSTPATLTEPFFNQCAQIFARWHAVSDTAAYHAGAEVPTVSGTASRIVYNPE